MTEATKIERSTYAWTEDEIAKIRERNGTDNPHLRPAVSFCCSLCREAEIATWDSKPKEFS